MPSCEVLPISSALLDRCSFWGGRVSRKDSRLQWNSGRCSSNGMLSAHCRRPFHPLQGRTCGGRCSESRMLAWRRESFLLLLEKSPAAGTSRASGGRGSGPIIMVRLQAWAGNLTLAAGTPRSNSTKDVKALPLPAWSRASRNLSPSQREGPKGRTPAA